MSDWSDDSAFWEAMEPALCAPARLGLAETDVAGIVDYCQLRPNARVLDLGCGPGGHAIAFARLGYRVTGVDSSPHLLEKARTASHSAGIQAEWIEADMRTFRRPASFELICSLYTSFGYFGDEQNRKVLEHIHANLAPGGALLLDVLGREAAARYFQERRWQEIDGVLYAERATTADDWSAMISHWIIVRNGNRADYRVRQRLYSSTELRGLLLSVGFQAIALAGTLDGKTPYNESARRLVVHARR